MVDEIVFWLICAIAAAGVWWAFFGRRHHPPPRDFCIEQQLQGMPAEKADRSEAIQRGWESLKTDF